MKRATAGWFFFALALCEGRTPAYVIAEEDPQVYVIARKCAASFGMV